MTLRRRFFHFSLLAATVALLCPRARAAETDIKRLAPADAYMVVYGKDNPERAYQAEYLADAWKTFRDERIVERVFDIVASRAPKDEMEKFKNGWKEVQTALEPIKLEALDDVKEVLVASIMVGPVGHSLGAVRLSEKDAEDYRQGIGNLFELVKKWSDGQLTTETSDVGGAKVTRLKMPEKVPFEFTVACVGDLFIFTTNHALLERALVQLKDPSAKSKFDDERFKESLKHLPAPEDAVTFFDAAQMFKGFEGIPNFIRAEKSGDENVERAIKLMERALKEIRVFDFETVVEYTEDNQNRVAAFGKLSGNLDSMLLGRALSHGKPFENWQSWVPAEATGYSLNTGIDLHEIYIGVVNFLREQVPESHEALDQWVAMQEKVGVNIDEDILQSFSGENVSITLPGQATVVAFKCKNSDKIRELLNRAVDNLGKAPELQQQNLELVDCDDDALEGFQELHLQMLMMQGAKPVIGFRDGWMIIASSQAAAKSLVTVRSGEAKSIASSESLERFHLKTDGEVNSVSYTDIGAGVRGTADAIDQYGFMAQMLVGASAQGLSTEDKMTISQAFSLLPSIAKVIRKFDFYEQSLSISRPGPSEGTYTRDSVTLIRKPAEK